MNNLQLDRLSERKSGRNTVVINIRGLGFKARSGGRREQILRRLKDQDEGRVPVALSIGLGMLIGAGIVTVGWWFI